METPGSCREEIPLTAFSSVCCVGMLTMGSASGRAGLERGVSRPQAPGLRQRRQEGLAPPGGWHRRGDGTGGDRLR